jgi:hypothetical protein
VPPPQQVIVVQGGDGSTSTSTESKIPATWLTGDWEGNHDKGCCSSDPVKIQDRGADAFDFIVANVRYGRYVRAGHTNNFNPSESPGESGEDCGCGPTIKNGMLNSVFIIENENLMRGGRVGGESAANLQNLTALFILCVVTAGYFVPVAVVIFILLVFGCCDTPGKDYVLVKMNKTDMKHANLPQTQGRSSA